MICLRGKISRRVHIALWCLECRIAEITPQDRCHPKLVGIGKRLGDLGDLTRRLIGAEINRRTDGDCTHIARLLDRAKHHLVELIRIRKKLVMIELYDKRYLVRITACDRAEHAECRCDGIASAFDRELYDIPGIEILRIRSKARTGRVLDPLIDRQDRNITCARKPAVIVQRLQTPQNARIAVRICPNAVNKIAARQMQIFLWDRF